MAIFASCGCEVFSGNDLIPVEWDEEDVDFDGPEPGFKPVTIITAFCPKCAETGIKDGSLRKSVA